MEFHGKYNGIPWKIHPLYFPWKSIDFSMDFHGRYNEKNPSNV
jgi:hypothetical protein